MLKDWFKQACEHGELEVINRLLSSESQANVIIECQTMAPNDFKILFTGLLGLIGSLKNTLKISQDDWLAALVSVSARPKSTAEPIATSSLVFTRFDDKKMIEPYESCSFASS